MKKTIALLAAVLLCALSLPVFAVDSPDERQTTITAEIAPAYTVTIPADVSVPFNARSTAFGNITLTEARLHFGYAVTVTLTASGFLKNAADPTKTIAYSVKNGENAFTAASYDTAGESTALTIEITEEAWNAAFAGEYSDTVTFTVTYGKEAGA